MEKNMHDEVKRATHELTGTFQLPKNKRRHEGGSVSSADLAHRKVLKSREERERYQREKASLLKLGCDESDIAELLGPELKDEESEERERASLFELGCDESDIAELLG